MKANQGIMGMAPAVLFFVTGVFWAGIIVTGGALLLFWAALTCFLSGAFLVVWASNWATRPLTVATALFGLALTVYQLYGAATVAGAGLGSIALYSGVVFAVFTVIYLYLLFTSWKTKT